MLCAPAALLAAVKEPFSIADMKRYQHRALCDSVELLAQDCMLAGIWKLIRILTHATRRKRDRKSFFLFKSVCSRPQPPPRNV